VFPVKYELGFYIPKTEFFRQNRSKEEVKRSDLRVINSMIILLLSFPLKHANRKTLENQVELKLNATLQLLARVHDVNLLAYNVDTIKKTT
jgi:hypothetical protein